MSEYDYPNISSSAGCVRLLPVPWQSEHLAEICHQLHRKVVICQKAVRRFIARQRLRQRVSGGKQWAAVTPTKDGLAAQPPPAQPPPDGSGHRRLYHKLRALHGGSLHDCPCGLDGVKGGAAKHKLSARDCRVAAAAEKPLCSCEHRRGLALPFSFPPFGLAAPAATAAAAAAAPPMQPPGPARGHAATRSPRAYPQMFLPRPGGAAARGGAEGKATMAAMAAERRHRPRRCCSTGPALCYDIGPRDGGGGDDDAAAADKGRAAADNAGADDDDDYLARRRIPPPKPKRNPGTRLSAPYGAPLALPSRPASTPVALEHAWGHPVAAAAAGADCDDDGEPVYIEMVGEFGRDAAEREEEEEAAGAPAPGPPPPPPQPPEQVESEYEEMKYYPVCFSAPPDAGKRGAFGPACPRRPRGHPGRAAAAEPAEGPRAEPANRIPPPFPELQTHRPPLLSLPPEPGAAAAQCAAFPGEPPPPAQAAEAGYARPPGPYKERDAAGKEPARDAEREACAVPTLPPPPPPLLPPPSSRTLCRPAHAGLCPPGHSQALKSAAPEISAAASPKAPPGHYHHPKSYSYPAGHAKGHGAQAQVSSQAKAHDGKAPPPCPRAHAPHDAPHAPPKAQSLKSCQVKAQTFPQPHGAYKPASAQARLQDYARARPPAYSQAHQPPNYAQATSEIYTLAQSLAYCKVQSQAGSRFPATAPQLKGHRSCAQTQFSVPPPPGKAAQPASAQPASQQHQHQHRYFCQETHVATYSRAVAHPGGAAAAAAAKSHTVPPHAKLGSAAAVAAWMAAQAAAANPRATRAAEAQGRARGPAAPATGAGAGGGGGQEGGCVRAQHTQTYPQSRAHGDARFGYRQQQLAATTGGAAGRPLASPLHDLAFVLTTGKPALRPSPAGRHLNASVEELSDRLNGNVRAEREHRTGTPGDARRAATASTASTITTITTDPRANSNVHPSPDPAAGTAESRVRGHVTALPSVGSAPRPAPQAPPSAHLHPCRRRPLSQPLP